MTPTSVLHATSPSHETIWRSYDRLEVCRLGPGIHSFAGQSAAELEAWPLLAVYAPEGGAVSRASGASTDMIPGGLGLLQGGEDFTIEVAPGCTVVVLWLPAAAIGLHRAQFDGAAGQVWPTRNGTASLVAHLLDGIIEQIAVYEPTSPARLAQHVVGFLAMMCADSGGKAIASPHHRRTLAAAKAHIDERLGDVELSPADVAKAMCMSPRSLQRLFEVEGTTVTGWIRARRLEQCRQELEERAFDDLSVSAIGCRWGLWDAAYFSRVFKAAYGLPPSGYREAARRQRAGAQRLASA
jgi:AraC-like DNA-binding protein